MVRCLDVAAAFGRHRAARPGQLLCVAGFEHCRSAAAVLMSQDVVATVYSYSCTVRHRLPLDRDGLRGSLDFARVYARL